MTRTKIAIAAAALIAATSTAALAQGSTRAQHHRNVHVQSAPVLQQRNVSLPSEGTSAGPFWYSWGGPSKGGM
jgi:hypothetical protein